MADSKTDFEFDYYGFLEVGQGDGDDTVSKAIRAKRRIARDLSGHVDLDKRSEGEQMMKRLGEAEYTLLDPARREEYNRNYRPPAPASPEKDWTAVAEEYYDNGQYSMALIAAKDAIQQNPNDGYAWYLRMWAAFKTDQLDEAEYSAHETLKFNPDVAIVHGLLGDVYYRQSRYDVALEEYEKAAELDPEASYYCFKVIQITYVCCHGNLEKVLKVAREGHAKFPDDQDIKRLLVRVMLQSIQFSCSYEGDSYYYTNKRQIKHAEELLSEIDALAPFDDEELSRQVEEEKKHLKKSKRRVFVAPPVLFWIILIVTVAGVYFQFIPPTIYIPIFILLALFVNFKVFPKLYKMVRKELGKAAKTGLQ